MSSLAELKQTSKLFSINFLEHFIPGCQYGQKMAFFLNFFNFSSIVLNVFPKALRQIFKAGWDNTLGHRPGFQLWHDSTAVRNLFASTKGGRTRVPTNLAVLKEKMNELKVALNERNVKYANECTSILKGVGDLKSLLTAIKQATSDTANKEDIEMLKQEIDEMKKAQEDRDEDNNQAYTKILEGVCSDITVLKKKVEGDVTEKEDIDVLELKVALDERDPQPKNSGNILNKPFQAKCCIMGIGDKHDGNLKIYERFLMLR